MTVYTVSYFIKNAAKFEESATVTPLGNGWFRVVKVTDVTPPIDPLEHAKTLAFPHGSVNHTLEVGNPDFVASKTKRKAVWKQNPLNQYSTIGKTK
jgi:hypothetical protein